MFTPWLASLALAQAPAAPISAEIESFAGASGPYLQAIREVTRLAGAKNWTTAEQWAARLPNTEVTLTWADANVPANRRDEFRAARDQVLAEWRREFPNYRFVLVPKGGEVEVSFADTLPPNEDTATPAGAVFFSSFAPSETTVEGVFAVRRTAQRQMSTSTEVYNELMHALALHFGLGRTLLQGPITSRQEGFYSIRNRFSRPVTELIRNHMATNVRIRTLLRAKRAPLFNPPILNLDTRALELGEVSQGDVIPFSIQVANNGKNLLRYVITPDCSCFVIRSYEPVPGQGVALVRGEVRTRDFPGLQRKELYFFTNDPEAPLKVIPVRFKATPRFRVLGNNGLQTYQLPESGLLETIFIALDPKRPFQVKAIRLAGRDGGVDFKPWKGSLPDPELNEPAQPREGFQVRLLLSPDIGVGRVPLSLEIETDDPVQPIFMYSFFVQRGIAIIPNSLFFGDVGKDVRTGFVTLSRPDREFSVTKVEVDSPHFRARLIAGERGDQRLEVRYLGTAPKGTLQATMKVSTTDKDQPLITVPILAEVP